MSVRDSSQDASVMRVSCIRVWTRIALYPSLDSYRSVSESGLVSRIHHKTRRFACPSGPAATLLPVWAPDSDIDSDIDSEMDCGLPLMRVCHASVLASVRLCARACYACVLACARAHARVRVMRACSLARARVLCVCYAHPAAE